jgi:NADPH-dependent glutamate synthase beta subunit-like oxidoreductase
MIRDIRRKQYADALLKIKERNPLVLSVGRVCSHPCENICRRNMADEAVAVHHLERFVGEWEMKLGHHIPVFCAPTTGQRVAVIGGGPAGLSCAYFLRRLGHSPTIFERKETLGGMLRYGITEYRLPRHLVDWDIHGIIGLGVEVKTRMSLGRDFTLDELTKDGYGAIFLGLGAWVVPSLCVDGEYLEGVMTSLDFLSRVNVTITTLSGTSAVIIGESNTAVDCARSCIRLGAKSVTMVCPVDQREMSARKNDVTRAMEEGVEMMFTTAPVRILPDSNPRAESLEVCQNEPKEKEGQGGIGRKIPGSEKRIPAALVISAYERKPDMDCLINIQTKKDIGENGVVFKSSRTYTLEAKEDTLMASPPNIFTAGDMHTGRASVITAVAGGRKAARSIHLLLTRGVIPVPDNIQHRINPKSILKKVCVARHIPKVRVEELPVSKRKTSFVEAVGPTIDQTRARVEAGRCLQCGIICNDP